MMKECPRCEGTGEITIIEDPENGVMDEYEYECYFCNGTGEVNSKMSEDNGELKLVEVRHVVSEIEFQKKEMIKYLTSIKIDEDTIDLAVDYFDTLVHGVEDHCKQYNLKWSW